MSGLLTYLETYRSTMVVEAPAVMFDGFLGMSPVAMMTLSGPTHPPVSSARCLSKGKPTSIRAPK